MITDALRRGYLAGRSLDLHERESDVRKGSGQRLMFRSEAITASIARAASASRGGSADR